MQEDEIRERDENERHKRKKRNKKIQLFRRLLIVLILFVIVFSLYRFRDDLAPENVLENIRFSFAVNRGGNGYPAKVAGNTISACGLMGESVFLTDTSFLMFNQNGGQVFNRQHGYANPKMKTISNRTIIFDDGGKRFRVESKTGTVAEKTTDQKIRAAAVSSSGVYGVVTGSKSDLAEMTIYRKNGSEMFKWYSSEYYILDMAVNAAGTGGAVAAFTTKSGREHSVIITFDFSQKQPKGKIELEGNMLLSVEYLQNGMIAAVGTTSACVVREDGQEKTEYSYEGKHLAGYSVHETGGIALALSGFSDLRKCSAVLLDASGRKRGEHTGSMDVRDVDYDGRRAVYLCGNQIVMLDNAGKQLQVMPSGADVSAVMLYKSRVLAIGMNEIRKAEAE